MKRRGIRELVCVLVLVSLWMTWQANQSALEPEVQTERPQEELAREKIFTINGVKLGDTLTQIEKKFGPSLTPPGMEEATDHTYQFGRVQGALGFADFTVVQVDSEQKAIMIQGNRLELNGERVAQGYQSLDDLGKKATLERLNELLGASTEKTLRAGGVRVLPEHNLELSIGKNGGWTFRLQEL